MPEIVTIVGARPQFIKASVTSRSYREHNLSEELLHTGQHFDHAMSDSFFKELNLPAPKVNLGIGGGSHGSNTGKMIEGIERALIDLKPKVVVVFGDTDSTLAGAISATKLRLPVVHVEAGLRSFNRSMPEEINRILADHSSDLLFTPTRTALKNLRNEGFDSKRVINSGDVMYDAIKIFSEKFEVRDPQAKKALMNSNSFVFLTMHRPQNVDNRDTLEAIFKGLQQIDSRIIFPVHPRTRKRIADFGIEVPNNIELLNPLGYFETQYLIRESSLVITDSGGIQKEAFFHQRRTLVLRTESEWKELEELGASQLIGNNHHLIAEKFKSLGALKFETSDTFGKGDSAMIIAKSIEDAFLR